MLTGQASLEDVKRTKKPIRSIVASFVAIVLGFFLISPAAQLSSAIDGNSIFGLILPILFVLSAMAAVAFFAYSLDFKGAGVRGAVKKAVILSILFVIAFAIEFYGAMLTSVVGLSSDITDISLDKYLLLALVAVVLTIIITKSFLASKRMVCQASLANRSNPPVEQANPQPEPPQQQNIQPSQTEPDHNEPDQSQTQ
ncbi:hypothetical protein CR969_02770 [Candidatus Saccharibacteria bacterium]|nr:MAG: hypothetical protein CR969_02770 [Candidatus Saccharibacteria bacterium]